ncbi:YqiJ family protein [Candidatus Pacearchaeota archaeon]|jgi:membrane protein implicated in regulation of membrane protease activity|nr:YqiJ family protein [Candidatus Pacearchaeota archaeon]
MEQFLAWYNLIFYLPLAIGVLFALGAGIDLGHDVELHGDVDVHADHDAEHDHDGDGETHGILGFLGIGKVPLAISMMALFLIFAGTGLIANIIFGFLIKAWSGFALISVGAAVVVSFFGTAFVSRTVARWMPTTETDSVTKHDLLGCSGKVILECSPKGIAQIHNRKGDMFQIQCKSDQPLEYGAKIITIDYDSASDYFTVELDPTVG